MSKDFESELKGTLEQATNAKQQIEKYFKRYGESDHEDAKKHQLMFGSKVVCSITKCNEKHLEIYCEIIQQTFGDQFKPETGLKYWTLYVNCIRYFHYQLINKKEFKMASTIYKHISTYDNKLQNAEIGSTLVSIYCYQLFLQNSLMSTNKELALTDANEILDRLTKLFNKILDTNKRLNLQYPDILKNTMQLLFPRNSIGTVCKFFNMLSLDKVKRMFESLFVLYGQHKTIAKASPEDVQDQAKCILETLNTFLHSDLIKLKLIVSLLSHCRTECRLQSDKPIAEIFLLLYDYMKLLCAQNPTLDFQRIYSMRCERFKELFDKHSKYVMAQRWFGDLLVFLYHIQSNLQNTKFFGCFWKQMIKADCFTSMFQLLVECIKLASCISSETKLFNVTCCNSIRKHVILSFAQIAIAAFIFYCQNVDPQDGHEEEINNFTDNYTETIHKLLIMIINYAFKCIDKMDCMSSTSQDINILLTRFKQATLSVKTSRQAGTCVAILELYLKIKTKIPSTEWPLLLRRLYKTVTQNANNTPNQGQELQMCYIASMLHESIEQIDIGQIRTQINIYYAAGDVPQQQQQHGNCLMHWYHTTTSLFRPHLEPSRKKLLHWLESQHILKYHKSNNPLLHSLLKTSQSQYDFVVITKAAKLHTYALAKISSIYKSMSSKAQEMGRLRRLEQLTFGHACLILLNDQFANQKFQMDTKHFNEDHLEELLMRKEMESFTINNELKRLKLALEALRAFEEFYKQFDNEFISFDEAIIDWESIMDDLTFLAHYLQLSGYMEYCSQVWLLHYKCARLIQDDNSALRSLTFFCEYSQYLDKSTHSGFKLEKELEFYLPIITVALENLSTVPRSNQSHILLAVLQIAYYYARTLRYSFAQILIEFVEQKHCELPDRQGRYDLIMATLDVIKFRLMWRQFEEKISAGCTTAQSSLLQQCLLHEMEETLDRFHKFQIISSSDGIKYSILMICLAQEFAECTANRLTDCFLSSFLMVSSKLSLQYGLALRFIQVMSMWMWINLQMEYVTKAQVKLKMIEYVMGVKSIKELTENCDTAMIDIQSSTLISTNCKDLISLNHNPGMEAIRKLAQVQLSPIKTGKLQISPSARNFDLKRYFKCNIEAELKPQNELMEWTFFTVGCLNARLYFLIEDYEQLETFYETGSKWLQKQKNTFNKDYYKNIYLMAMQHYVNFLRSQRRYDKALQCLEQALELCDTVKFNIDVVYYINFQLQLVSTRTELKANKAIVESKVQHFYNPRRALLFNDIPNSNSSGESSSSSSSNTNLIKPKQKTKFKICEDSLEIHDLDDIMKEIFGNCPEFGEELKITKRITTTELNDENKTPKISRKITKSLKTPAPDTGTSKKIKRPPPPKSTDIDLSDSPLSSPTNFLDVILSDSSLDEMKTKGRVKKTPAPPSTGTSKKIKRPPLPSTSKCQQHLNIDLSNSPSKLLGIILSDSSLDKLETKENQNFTNEIVEQMKNLEIEVNAKPTGTTAKPNSQFGPITGTAKKIKRPPPPSTSKCQRPIVIDLSDSTQLVDNNLSDTSSDQLEIEPMEAAAKPKSRGRRPVPPSDAIIAIVDSPIIPSVGNINVQFPKATRTRNRDKTPVATPSEAAVTTRPRRMRKLVLENDENPISSSTILPPTRRKQKNIV